MRRVILTFIAVAAHMGLAVPAQAVPAAGRYLYVVAPAIIEVLQRCGKGYHRQNAWQDKQGAWHGKCVPRPPKKNTQS